MTRYSTVDLFQSKEQNGGKRELALKLLIELLSYQLASPVRWIETQLELFQSPRPISRLIEIGPRTILTTMAKKSDAIFHTPSAPPQWPKTQFLSYQDDRPAIFYQYSEKQQSDAEPDPQESTPSTLDFTTPQPHKSGNQLARQPEAKFLCASPDRDVCLRASHVILAITAQKLRRPFDQVPIENTIRDLSGGKSTFQNELTGDLIVEFGRVPEGVEDISLSSLGESLRSEFSGKPAKAMSSLISRFISSKMPASFNQSAIQEYLRSRWGFSKSHAIIVLCFATTMEPADRLTKVDRAHAYFDDLVKRYAKFQGISWVPPAEQDSSNKPTTAVVDISTLGSFSQEHKTLYRSQYDALAKYLKVDYPPVDLSGPQSRITDLEEMLNRWAAEFGEQFFHGINSIFNSSHSRNYDSWWNWSREELIRWLNDVYISSPSTALALSCMDDQMKSTLNRWESSCTDIATFMLDMWSSGKTISQNCPCIDKVRPILEEAAILGAKSNLTDPAFTYTFPSLGPQTRISSSGQLQYHEAPRKNSHYPDIIRQGPLRSNHGEAGLPFIHIKTRRENDDWQYDHKTTNLFHTMLDVGASTGLTYVNKAVLITGAGPDSIASHIVQGLLSGGARVIVTTSRPISESAEFFQKIYRRYGARESSLTLLPMNQASKQDCELLIQHIYGPNSPTGGDLDYVIPFAAIPQTGEVEALGGRQELALRAMLVNLLRLIGFVRREKERLRIKSRPTMVVLPMSCNEGTFGGDGLYSESKIGLRSLFNRFHSETWSTYITICGAVIGWTRGTTIMRSSNMVAEEMEKLGVITFTQAEMAFNILALMTPAITALADDAPIYADLTGGFGSMWNIKTQISAARKRVSGRLQLQTAIAEEDARHQTVLLGSKESTEEQSIRIKTGRANLSLKFPPLPDIGYDGSPGIQGMVDLSRVVVVVGYSELGPWGNARTRWEIEHQGKLSLEGYVEMAWIMGLIKHVDGNLNGQPYVGWVDNETQAPIEDDEVPKKYHNHIMAHAGLRLIEPHKGDSYDPSRKEFLHEVAVEEDLPSFETSKSTAEAFKLRHGEHATIQSIPDSDDYRVYIKKGAVLMIPKTVPFHQLVGGRIPEGWDPSRYGIPEDIVQQVDTTTLYALCCVSEAFLSAGIKDPYELYQYIHVSELANCLGTGGGPLKVIQNMYRDRYLDRQVRGDIILEHFLNTMGAWVNMLLLSATGPLKTPVGACATALESLDIGCDAIQTGKCKVAIVGGCDDYGEELAYEFANIKATANSAEELARGRKPAEISRPTASSRSGFAESAGCGVQILMSAELAIEMGLPIYGVVAYTQMASDQIGRSIPAPGKGVLTAARQTNQARCSPILDLDFRRAKFDEEIAEISKSIEGRLEPNISSANPDPGAEFAGKLRIRDAQRRWGNEIRQSDPSISPINAALATWGLTVDDIKVVSMHGTSTKANEVNEGEVINTQMDHLGRRRGNPLLSVCQKWLTGHPKAAAGAWQLNGCLQMLQQGIVPGNRNADNVDAHLRQYTHLVYPMQSMHVTEINATMLTSFGFGQKGAINIMISPRYLFASITEPLFRPYRARVTKRQRSATPEFISRVMKNALVQVKSQPPWGNPSAMQDFLLDPSSRVVDGKVCLNRTETGIPSYFPLSDNSASTTSPGHPLPISSTVQAMIEKWTHRPCPPNSYLGVDVEEIANINIDNEAFINRNFTPAERAYCLKSPNPRASFTGRWSAKEAVFKSLQTSSAGAGAGMSDIEIISVDGIPKVILHGQAQETAASKGIRRVEVTISHSSGTAIAMALAIRK